MPTNKKRAVIFARISKADGEESGELEGKVDGIESQISACERYIEAQGWELVETFSELVSGYDTEAERQGFKQLKDRIKKRDVDVVLVWRIDRISRRVRATADFADLLKKYDVELVSQSEGQLSGLMITILSALAQQEAEVMAYRLKTRFKDDFEGTNKEGTAKPKIGGQRPYGYQVVKDDKGKPIEPYYRKDKHEAAIIRRMAEWVLAYPPGAEVRKQHNRSTNMLVQELKADGVLTQHNQPWRWQSIKDKLSSPLIAGYIARTEPGSKSRLIRKGKWDAIITEYEWRGLREIFNLRQTPVPDQEGVFRLTPTPGETRRAFARVAPLSGLVYSSKTGALMHACTHHLDYDLYGSNTPGDGTSIQREVLEMVVFQWIGKQIEAAEWYEEHGPSQAPRRTIDIVQAELEEAEETIDKWVLQKEGAGADSQRVKQNLEDAYTEERRLRDELQNIENDVLRPVETKPDGPAREWFGNTSTPSIRGWFDEASVDEKRALAREWIERIEVCSRREAIAKVRGEMTDTQWRAVKNKEVRKAIARVNITSRKTAVPEGFVFPWNDPEAHLDEADREQYEREVSEWTQKSA